jgi:hypothetical protein
MGNLGIFRQEKCYNVLLNSHINFSWSISVIFIAPTKGLMHKHPLFVCSLNFNVCSNLGFQPCTDDGRPELFKACDLCAVICCL